MKKGSWMCALGGVGLGVLALSYLSGGCVLPPPVPQNAQTVTLQTIATGLGSPVAFAAPSDGTGRLFVVEQAGTIRVIANGLLADTPLLDVTAELDPPVSSQDERGLLGLALHPDFAANGRLFVYFNTPPSADAPAETMTEVRLSEFRASGQANIAATERVLLRIPKPQINHNAGQLAFGPDGFLYIGVGDGGGENDDEAGHTPGLGNGQDTTTLLGKILRIDVDSGDPYSIPASNPFVGDGASRPEIFAYGFRNPWRFSFDDGPNGLGQLFAGDVGQALMEEVDIVTLGGNYGWRIKEGTLCFNVANHNLPLPSCADTAASGAPLIGPILTYTHDSAPEVSFGSAVIGGFVYRGTAVPSLVGQYLFGDYMIEGTSTGKLFLAHQVLSGTWTFDELRVAGTADGRLGRFVLAFGRDTAGELYVLSRGDGGPTGTTGQVDQIVGLN